MKKILTRFIDKLNIVPFLCLVFILNLLDAHLTLTWVEAGIATEANPIMANLINLGGEWFMIGKIGAVSLACFFLYYCKHIRASKIVALISCVLYLIILGIHIHGVHDLGIPFLWIF